MQNPLLLRTSADAVTDGVLGASALSMSMIGHALFVGLVITVPIVMPMCALSEPVVQEKAPPVFMEMVKVEPPPPPPKVEEVAPKKTEPKRRAKKRSRSRARRAAIASSLKNSSGLLAILGTTGGSGGQVASVFGSSSLEGDLDAALGGLVGNEIGVAEGFGGLGLRGTGRGGGGSAAGIGSLGGVVGGVAGGKVSTAPRARVVVVDGERRPVLRVLRRHQRAVARCLDDGGSARVEIADGRVTSTDACVHDKLKRARAPRDLTGTARFVRR